MDQASNPLRATRGDMAVRENAPVAPTDLPAPGEAVAVPSPLSTATASTFDLTARFLLQYARAARDLGVQLPFEHELEGAARRLLALDWPTCAPASAPAPPATVEIGTAEMATRMGCSEQWIRHLCQAGRMPGARKDGRDWRIHVQEEEHADPTGSHPRGRPRG